MIECIGLTGRQAMPYLEELAKLRCSVFREYPYLYDGDSEAERAYLANYADSENVFLIVTKAEGKVVGVSTCMPMAEADEAFQKPFNQAQSPLDEICYFGESVLMPEYRGLGAGHRFFDLREQWASVRGFSINAFCAVIRPLEDPRRPADYRPHDRFWSKRGYQRHDYLVAQLDWREIGDAVGRESSHDLVFWLKS